MCPNVLINPFFFRDVFVSVRLTFNVRPNSKVKKYGKGQNITKCYNGSMWPLYYGALLVVNTFTN